MKATVLLAVLLAMGSAQANAQAIVDRFSTVAECLATKEAPFYYPSIVSKRRVAANEVVRGHSTGGCFEMDLPDRVGGRGFVRVELGREFVYNRLTGQVLRLAECNNTVYSWRSFLETEGRVGLTGPMGPQGPQGIQGLRGENGRDGQVTTFPQSSQIPPQYIVVNSGRPRWPWIVGSLITGGILGAVIHHNWPRGSAKAGPPIVTTLPPGPG